MKINHSILWMLLFFNMSIVSAEERIDAIVDWAQRVDLTIPVEGIVQKVNVNTGQIVNKGHILVKLDSRVFSANLSQAKAKVNSLKASYDEMKRELMRAHELYDRTVLSDHDLQIAKNNEISAKSNLETSKSDYVRAQVDLERASLVAPFDSIILKRNVEVGMAIINRDTYQTIITLASSQNFLAKAPLTQAQDKLVRIGQNVKVISDTTTYNAKVIAIEYALSKSVGHSVLVVMFTSQDKKLHAGSKVKILY